MQLEGSASNLQKSNAGVNQIFARYSPLQFCEKHFSIVRKNQIQK